MKIKNIYPGNTFKIKTGEIIEIYRHENEYFLRREETEEIIKVVDFWIYYSNSMGDSQFYTLPLPAMIELLNILKAKPLF